MKSRSLESHADSLPNDHRDRRLWESALLSAATAQTWRCRQGPIVVGPDVLTAAVESLGKEMAKSRNQEVEV